MLDARENERLTRVESGSAAGRLLREYWMPAALSEELEVERPVIPVRLFGEDLVLFRDGDGELGLIQRHCPHRGVDLCYARREASGREFIWEFDTLAQKLAEITPGLPIPAAQYKQLCDTCRSLDQLDDARALLDLTFFDSQPAN